MKRIGENELMVTFLVEFVPAPLKVPLNNYQKNVNQKAFF
jgi:hypothetical protein